MTFRKVLLIGLVPAVLLGLWLAPGRAFGVTRSQCEAAWFQPHGQVAQACRARGWIIHRRVSVDPHRVVHHDQLRHCAADATAGPCIWSAREDGTGSGVDYLLTRGGRVRYVWTLNPADSIWRWVNASTDAALDNERRPRHWTRCVTYSGYLACPWRGGVFAP